MARQRNSSDYTALMIAAQSGFKEAVLILINEEAGMQDSRGFTALMYALLSQQWETATMLLEKEANLTTKDGFNARTLLSMDEISVPLHIKTSLAQLEPLKP